MMTKKLIPIAALAFSFLLGMVASANAQYGPNGQYRSNSRATVGAKAQYVYDVSGDAQQSLFKQFYRSRNYGELLGKIGQIRGKAIQIRTLSRIDVCETQIVRQAEYLDKLIHDFDSLVEIARRRSELGLDKPLRGCTLHLDAKIKAMLDAVHCMNDELARPSYQRVDYRRDYRSDPGPSYYRKPTNHYRYSPQTSQPYTRQPRSNGYRNHRGSNVSGLQIDFGPISYDSRDRTIRYNR